MDDQMSAGVTSAAARVLRDLQHDGFVVELTAAGAVTIAPRSRLTPARMRLIAAHKEALKTELLRDLGLLARRERFEQQIARSMAPRVPALLFTPGIPYAKGTCFSCGDALPELAFGRCWRCSLAWRLACRLPLAEPFAKALDDAKVVA
jgi:hypothetical protein